MDGISAIDVHKAFGQTRALDGCTLRAYPGEIHAVVGENGSGKSTFAKVLSGVLSVDRGTVSIFGQAPASPVEARALGVATIYQEVLVADEMSLTANLFVGADRAWRLAPSARERREAAHTLMHRLTGLSLDCDRPVGDLPLALKQWIVIGRALIGNPRVLIFDESSAALDLEGTTRLHEEMRRLCAAGACVLIISHRIAELVRIADRATVLRDGRSVGELEGSQITEKNLLALMTAQNRAPAEASAATMTAAPCPGEARPALLAAPRLQLKEGATPFDFAIAPGEVVGIIGLDGHGQDRFAKVLAGVTRAYAGHAVVAPADGGIARPIRDLVDAERLGVAYVSGDRKSEGLFPNLSTFENFAIGLYGRTASATGWIRRAVLEEAFAREIKRFATKTGNPSQLITSLSGGNQQKVLISRALARSPRVLVLNDPARGVDFATKRELYAQLRVFAQAGGSVVYVSSELEEFFDFVDRVDVFHDATVFASLSGAAICEERILAAMFAHDEPIVFHPEPEGLPA